MRTIVLAIALALVPPTLADDSERGVNTFILQDGTTTRVSGSMDDLDHFEAKMRETSEPALFMRVDGKDYVVTDPTVVARARDIFSRSIPVKAEKRALKQERQNLIRRQHQQEARGGDGTEAAELDAEERSLEARQEQHDAERERVSREMSEALDDLAREAIRAGRAR